jgi:hypothetical protein
MLGDHAFIYPGIGLARSSGICYVRLILRFDRLECWQMATRVVVGIAALVCVSVCGISSMLASWEMMDKVNDKLPKEEQFATLWWYAAKSLRLSREYKRLYPDGNLLLKIRVLRVLMIACLIACAWGFGFFA